MRWLVRPVGQCAGEHRGEIAGGEADQRVVGIERRHDQLRRPRRCPPDRSCARPNDLDQHALVDDQPVARARLVRDQAEVGGAVGLVGGDAALAEPVAQRRRHRLAAQRCLGERRQREAGLVGLFRAARAGSFGVFRHRPSARSVGHRLQLQLGLAGAGRKDGAADRVRAAFHHRAGRREVIAEAVVDQVAGAKAGGEERSRHAPVVGTRTFGLVDRPGRGKHAQGALRWRPNRAPADGREAAERIARTPERCWLSSSSRLRRIGSVASAARARRSLWRHRRRRSRSAKAGAWALRRRRSAPRRHGHQRRLALVGGARLEGVVET